MTEAERIEKEQPPHETLRGLVETLERETVPMPGHQDPNALKDCWRFVYDLIEEMLNECSHLAANTCPYSYGDEHGHQRCSEHERLQQQVKEKEIIIDAQIMGIKLEMEENLKLKAKLKSAQELNWELVEGLEQIAYPIKHLQKEAEEQGAQLNGMMAIALSNDPNYLKQIAESLINKTKSI